MTDTPVTVVLALSENAAEVVTTMIGYMTSQGLLSNDETDIADAVVKEIASQLKVKP